MNRRKSAQDERRQRAEEAQLRELERRNQQEQKNFEAMMSAMAAAAGQGDRCPAERPLRLERRDLGGVEQPTSSRNAPGGAVGPRSCAPGRCSDS